MTPAPEDPAPVSLGDVGARAPVVPGTEATLGSDALFRAGHAVRAGAVAIKLLPDPASGRSAQRCLPEAARTVLDRPEEAA